jgi:hypothetical protein
MEGLGRKNRVSELPSSGFVQMPVTTACELATECWRVGKLTKASFVRNNDRLAVERAVRRFKETLAKLGIFLVDLAGSAYDPGIASEVLEVVVDNTLPDEASLVDETIMPTVVWNNKIIQVGQVVVRQSPKKQDVSGDVV